MRCRDVTQILGEPSAGADAGSHEVTLGDLVQDLVGPRRRSPEDLEGPLEAWKTGSQPGDGRWGVVHKSGGDQLVHRREIPRIDLRVEPADQCLVVILRAHAGLRLMP